MLSDLTLDQIYSYLCIPIYSFSSFENAHMVFRSNHCEKRNLQAGLHKFREMNSKAYHLLYDMFGLYFLVKNNVFLRG